MESLQQPPLTFEEKQFYESAWAKLPKNPKNQVSGQIFRKFVDNSGLDARFLYQVWTHLDTDNDGFINYNEFCTFLKYIAAHQGGIQFNKFNPQDPSWSRLPVINSMPPPLPPAAAPALTAAPQDDGFGDTDDMFKSFTEPLPAKGAQPVRPRAVQIPLENLFGPNSPTLFSSPRPATQPSKARKTQRDTEKLRDAADLSNDVAKLSETVKAQGVNDRTKLRAAAHEAAQSAEGVAPALEAAAGEVAAISRSLEAIQANLGATAQMDKTLLEVVFGLLGAASAGGRNAAAAGAAISEQLIRAREQVGAIERAYEAEAQRNSQILREFSSSVGHLVALEAKKAALSARVEEIRATNRVLQAQVVQNNDRARLAERQLELIEENYRREQAHKETLQRDAAHAVEDAWPATASTSESPSPVYASKPKLFEHAEPPAPAAPRPVPMEESTPEPPHSPPVSQPPTPSAQPQPQPQPVAPAFQNLNPFDFSETDDSFSDVEAKPVDMIEGIADGDELFGDPGAKPEKPAAPEEFEMPTDFFGEMPETSDIAGDGWGTDASWGDADAGKKVSEKDFFGSF